MGTSHTANSDPAPAPNEASRKLSTSIDWIRRALPAPNASRIANSPRRAVARANRRPATFEHAMSSTSPKSTSNRTGKRINSGEPRTCMPRTGKTRDGWLNPSFSLGYMRSSCCASAVTAGCTCSSVVVAEGARERQGRFRSLAC